MARTFKPFVSIHGNDYRDVEYFDLSEPIRKIRSMCYYLTGGASSAEFNIEPCSNSLDLIMAIQRLAQKQEMRGVFGFSRPREAYIQEVTVNKKSATVVIG